jgi:hypothetical protein
MARKRELIEPHPGDKRYIRRAPNGQFTDGQVDVGRSLSKDVQQHAKKVVPKGQGEKGDQKWAFHCGPNHAQCDRPRQRKARALKSGRLGLT